MSVCVGEGAMESIRGAFRLQRLSGHIPPHTLHSHSAPQVQILQTQTLQRLLDRNFGRIPYSSYHGVILDDVVAS